MDPASSSVGFPLSGNPQSPQNPPPLDPPSAGISPSENPQSSASSLPSNPSSSAEPYCNGPPSFVVSAKDWNVELTKLFHDDNFKFYMCGGECEQQFMDWCICMHGVVEIHDGNWDYCSYYSGVLRDCVFANLGYYKPLLTYFSDRARR